MQHLQKIDNETSEVVIKIVKWSGVAGTFDLIVCYSFTIFLELLPSAVKILMIYVPGARLLRSIS